MTCPLLSPKCPLRLSVVYSFSVNENNKIHKNKGHANLGPVPHDMRIFV